MATLVMMIVRNRPTAELISLVKSPGWTWLGDTAICRCPAHAGAKQQCRRILLATMAGIWADTRPSALRLRIRRADTIRPASGPTLLSDCRLHLDEQFIHDPVSATPSATHAGHHLGKTGEFRVRSIDRQLTQADIGLVAHISNVTVVSSVRGQFGIMGFGMIFQSESDDE